MSEEGSRFCDPVTLPGTQGVFERAVVLQKIKGKSKMSYGLKLHEETFQHIFKQLFYIYILSGIKVLVIVVLTNFKKVNC